MLKRLTICVVLFAALAFAPAAQAAPFLVGGISMASTSVPPGLNPVMPIGAMGVVLPNFLGATALDFNSSAGVQTPGVAGTFAVNSTSGNFNLQSGMMGSIMDFSFLGLGQANYPAPRVGLPIVGFERTFDTEFMQAPTFSFDLWSVSVLLQNETFLVLSGRGLFHMDGFEATEGSFDFTAQNSGSTFSYSASGAAPVPEPGSMLLLGTGLFGLAGMIRRKIKK